MTQTKQDQRELITDQGTEIANMLGDNYTMVDEYLSEGKMRSVRSFIRQLGMDEVVNSMNTALDKDLSSAHWTFKYFCGVCWRKIKGDQEDYGVPGGV